MDQLKRTFGLLWMLLAFAALIAVILMAKAEIARKPTADTWIQWGVFVGITLPIAIGLFLFGLFAFKGEYDRLPTRSSEL
jgi:ABC-type dipeptide/oligopeptide/nickel transport system permease component